MVQNIVPNQNFVPDLATLEKLRNQVLIKRPFLKEIIKKKGEKKLCDYVQDYIDVNLSPTIPRRQQELLGVVYDTVNERFGKSLASSVRRQLEQYYFVSTADHDGPLTSPFFVNSNLLIASALMNRTEISLKNVIVLACANISADNSTFPRGLFFHNYSNGVLNTRRLPFFSSNVRPGCVYKLPAYGQKELKKAYDELNTFYKKGEIGQEEYEKIQSLFKEVYDRPEILACGSYMEQVSKTNYKLWPKLFSNSGVKLPNLVYLELEDIVRKLLINYHLHSDTILNHILFDADYEPYLNNYFDGIFGSFSRKNSTGTYLFWALPKDSRYNLQLWRKGNYLVSKNETYKIELNPEAIREAMISKELIPGLLLDFMTVSFYYGLKCLGGFNQVNYLTLMKNSYIKMNADLGNYRSIEICARSQTKEICDGLSAAFMGYNSNQMTPASGLDLILYNQKDSWNKFVQTTKQITLAEALNPQMPEIYKISYENKEWDSQLTSLTESAISRLTHLEEKTQPCVYLK